MRPPPMRPSTPSGPLTWGDRELARLQRQAEDYLAKNRTPERRDPTNHNLPMLDLSLPGPRPLTQLEKIQASLERVERMCGMTPELARLQHDINMVAFKDPSPEEFLDTDLDGVAPERLHDRYGEPMSPTMHQALGLRNKVADENSYRLPQTRAQSGGMFSGQVYGWHAQRGSDASGQGAAEGDEDGAVTANSGGSVGRLLHRGRGRGPGGSARGGGTRDPDATDRARSGGGRGTASGGQSRMNKGGNGAAGVRLNTGSGDGKFTH